MDKNVAIELTLRPVDADRTDDTTGFIARDGGCFPQPSGVVIRLPVPVLERVPVPGPGPVNVSLDVQGFQLEVAPAAGPDDEDTAGYLWHIYALTAAAFFGAGYGLGSAYIDATHEDTIYNKYDR